MKKLVAIIASVLAVASVLVGFQIAGPAAQQERASALSGSSFQAGNIISDANFYNGTAMTVDQVQTFLNGQVSSCTNSGCLRNGRYSMNSRGADAMCSAVTGGSSLSAAQILTRVGAACGISPKVMLVTLQKEQGLVTSRGPSAAVLERAMGYACPDNVGGHCDPAYAGVGNQVYWSAWQWKRYGNPAGTSNYFTWFNPGGDRAIQYNVPTSCGTKSVAVQNKATAALYYYTPYTPNTAALGNLYGTGDGCSAYGNRNFWRMYTDWFGSTTSAPTTAKGNLDGVTASWNTVSVNGWALDTRTKSSTKVVVTVGSTTRTIAANANRSDIASAYGLGAAHGFSATIAAPPGSQQVCVTAKAATGSTSASLGCKTVTVLDGSPTGSLDSVVANKGGTVTLTGWAVDPEAKGAIGARVYRDGQYVTRVSAGVSRADVASAYPALGGKHGFATTIPTTVGAHSYCVTGVNVKAGADRQVGSCRSVTSPGSTPIGKITSIPTTSSSIRVAGWALDGDATGPITVRVSIDGVEHGIRADRTRQDVGKTYPAWGTAHGFSGTWLASIGTHRVCVTANGVGAGPARASIGCKQVTVRNTLPVGSLDTVTGGTGTVTAAGWALDTDTKAAPVSVDVYVDGVGKRVLARAVRYDVDAAYPGAGAQHGWTLKVAAKKGARSVCAYAIDSQGGPNATLGCRTVTVR
ncbi:hypothetical protein E9228_002882 [Curtobacterium flaccumfaciens]|uniref:Hemagglutinin n=1 Tax=Curtobacterium salicis TaxID=1779862 RepID=A0ABX0TB43_9MICO|nr:hypothetical protein [Curtobacterium sp. WW7]NII42224.1 hypothetical protein [Curtobacterium sp. WW7]